MAKFKQGDQVRVLRTCRNDGTYPGKEIGDLLVTRGACGYVKDIGTYLQDQTIYAVHFFDDDAMVGCREEELIGIDEEWVPSRFEFREKVKSKLKLAVKGEVIADIGDVGEIIKVLRWQDDGVAYHVRFPGHTLLVPEASLEPVELTSEEVAL